MTTPLGGAVPQHSPFAGQLVHRLEGSTLGESARPPLFDEDRWDFAGLPDTAVQLKPSELLFDFTTISNPYWRPVAKELMIAMLCPKHPALLDLPNVRRSPLHLRTCHQRLFAVTKWFEWLAEHDVTSLEQVTQEHCDRYLQLREASSLSAAARMHMVHGVKEIAHYGQLFTADRYRPDFIPWRGKPAAAVAAFTSQGENKTQPVAEDVLAPVVRAGMYLVTVLGPHLPELLGQIQSDRARSPARKILHRTEFAALMDRHVESGDPLPMVDQRYVSRRLARGWRLDDPLLRVNFQAMCQELGLAQFYEKDLPKVRDLAERAVSRVGVEPRWARNAVHVATANDIGTVPWTLPMTSRQITDFANVVFDACLVLTAALSGMRASELMELTTASTIARLRNGGQIGAISDAALRDDPYSQRILAQTANLVGTIISLAPNDHPTPNLHNKGRPAGLTRKQGAQRQRSQQRKKRRKR